MRTLVPGVLAGASGTTASTWSPTSISPCAPGHPAAPPERSVQRLADLTGVPLGGGEQAQNRRTGLGALLGYATGLGSAAGYALP